MLLAIEHSVIQIMLTILHFYEVVDCGDIMELSNGKVVTSNGTTFNSTATFTCDSGYTLSGSQTRRCGADGNWIFQNPSLCESK